MVESAGAAGKIAGVEYDSRRVGRGAAFVAGQQSTRFPNAPLGLIFPGDTGVTSALMPASYGYWEPRLGVAWQPRFLPHTVFHAGYGLFTESA